MGYERQPDCGTPEVQSATTVTLAIDGREVGVPLGTTVMRAAAEPTRPTRTRSLPAG